MARAAIVSLFLFWTLLGWAQPEYFGCHHFKGKRRLPKMTEEQKQALQLSNARSDTFNIVHYDISLDVTADELNLLSAATRIDYSPLMDDLSSITLDLYDLVVDSVTDASGQLNFNYTNNLLQVYFSESPAAEDTLNMTVFYHGVPYADPFWGGVYFELGYIYNLGIGLTTIPPNFGKVWYPCFDTFVERASYTYHVKSDGGRRAICQGEFLGEEVLGGDTLLRHYNLDEQITSHVSAFAVNDYVTTELEHSGTYGTYPVLLHSVPTQQASMEAAFADIHYTIDALEHWFGPYPYDHVGYVMTTDGALEIVTNIAYPTSMLGQPLTSNGRLSSHELGHHWWGDQVALTTHNDMWLKEGPAEYSAHLYVEWKDGQEAFIDAVKSNQLFVLEEAPQQDEGFYPMSPMPDPVIYGRHTYYKGAAVLHNLRGYLGDELFRLGMTELQLSHAEESYTPELFEAWLEDATGEDLSDFFADWALKPGWSAFVVDSTETEFESNLWTSTVFVQQKLRKCPSWHNNVPISVSVLDSDWNWHHYPATVGGQYTTLEVETEFEPVLITLNADTKLTQCWLDYDQRVYPDETFNAQVPFVDFRLIKNDVADSAFVRVEHVWAGPDDWNLADNILEISNGHYWNVGGIWPDGYDLEARVDYDGHNEWTVDYDLVFGDEEGVMLVYREDASQQWAEYADQTVITGAPTNGTGTIKIDVLIPGQYAFAKRDPNVSVDGPLNTTPDDAIVLFPNPAVRDFLHVQGAFDYRGNASVSVYDLSGKRVLEEMWWIDAVDALKTIDVAPLSPGLYQLVLRNDVGTVMDATQFNVMR